MQTDNLLRSIKFYKDALTINNIHSPYIFNIVKALFDFSKSYYLDFYIEQEREKLLRNTEVLSFQDLGASKGLKERTIAQIARSATSNKYKCQLMRSLVSVIKPNQVLELGTNLGIMSAYLATMHGGKPYHTVEGVPEILSTAEAVFRALRIKNISTHNSTFQSFLNQNEALVKDIDFFYLDGDHTYENTLNYFDIIYTTGPAKKCIVLDDINWSKDMSRAWNEIKSNYQCRTIDIYKIGIVLCDADIKQSEHYKCVPRYLKPWKMGFFS